MRRSTNSQKRTVDIEMGGDVQAPTVAKAPEQVRAPWDLVRRQARTWVEAEALAEALAGAEAEAEVKLKALARQWATEQARQLAWAWRRGRWWAAEKTQSATVLEGLGLNQVQVQAWLRMWSLEVARQQKSWDFDSLRYSWPDCGQDYWSLIQIIIPISRLPLELLQQILLIIIDNTNDSPLVLMQVSKLWHDTVTGIWASLKLGTTTPTDVITRKLERKQWLLDVVIDTEIDRGHLTPEYYLAHSLIGRASRNCGLVVFPPSEDPHQAIFAAMRAASRWRSLVVESFPAKEYFLEDLLNHGLQQCSDLVMTRLKTLIIKCPCEMSPLLDRLLHVLGNTASRELTTVTIYSPIVVSYLVPTYSSIFHSVTILSLDVPGLPNPLDLLPHLHQLETLTASHLLLPVYRDDVDLPFIHTLRHLTLRAVSIQWLSGRIFHALESCTLSFHFIATFCTHFAPPSQNARSCPLKAILSIYLVVSQHTNSLISL
jgi:hypothetical protein